MQIASEFRYEDPILNKNDIVIVISQSGETADTIGALHMAKKQGIKTLSIVNVVGSTIAKTSDCAMYTCAGPEIAVATTKAYSTQLCILYLLSVYMADKKGLISKKDYNSFISEFLLLHNKIETILKSKKDIQYLASKFFNCSSAFYVGRNIDYAVAMEGSLKLKEISYIHSESYSS